MEQASTLPTKARGRWTAAVSAGFTRFVNQFKKAKRRRKLQALEKKRSHHANPAGSKLLRRFHKAKFGGDSAHTGLAEAAAWYARLGEPKFRQGESQKRINRTPSEWREFGTST